MVNEPLPLPRPSLRYVRAAEHPTRGPDYRCMLCGAWYEDHRAGNIVSAGFKEGAALVRETARAAGDDSGGYRSRGPVLWAMRVLKMQDFILSHESAHGPLTASDRAQGWGRNLLPTERVSPTPGKPTRDHLSWEPSWTAWTRTGDQGLLVWDPDASVYRDDDGKGWACDEDACRASTHAAVSKRLARASDAEEPIPF